MIRSKILPITLAAFCGLALQFHASGANAQSVTLFPGGTLNLGWALRTGNRHTLVMQQDGNVVLYNRNIRHAWPYGTTCQTVLRL